MSDPTQARRQVLRLLKQKPSPAQVPGLPSNPLLGLMRDDADLMDEITADAYRRRREDKGRIPIFE